jgi:hypothetical protein
VSLANTFPGFDRLRRPPAKLAHRRGGKGHAPEKADRFINPPDTLKDAAGDGNQVGSMYFDGHEQESDKTDSNQ